MNNRLRYFMLTMLLAIISTAWGVNITFEDANVKAICVEKWDTNHDGELSNIEAAAVKSISGVFSDRVDITSFNELQYFTGLTSLPSTSFSGCKYLKKITIPNTVKTISWHSFYECKNLSSVIIPNSVNSIEIGAFWACNSLRGINIPNSVTSIGSFAFYDCYSLSEIILPNTLKYIENSTFCNCKNLSKVVIPNSVTQIKNNVFQGCTILSKITIPNSVTYIGEGAFYDCPKLNKVIVDKSTPLTITSSTFSNRFNAILAVPEGCVAKYQNAQYWKDFKNIIESNIITFADYRVEAICKYNWDTDGDDVFTTIEAADVKDIHDAFINRSDITSFDEFQHFIGVDKLGERIEVWDDTREDIINVPSGFSGCTNLKSITLPNSLVSIGEAQYGNDIYEYPRRTFDDMAGAFTDCKSLTNIVIPNSVKVIGDMTFKGCTSLRSITIPNSVNSIGAYAFEGCSKLNNIIIPDLVTRLLPGTFKNCSSLSNVVLPNSLTDIYGADWVTDYHDMMEDNCSFEISSPFEGCTSLSNLNIPNSVKNIGPFAFYKNNSLQTLNVPNTLVSIGEFAFYGCKAIKEFTIPQTMKYIEAGTFAYSGLKSINIPESVIGIKGYSFIVTNQDRYWEFLYKYQYYNNKEYFLCAPCGAFEGCNELKTINANNNITTIGDCAFRNCVSLESIDFLSKINNIGCGAFSGCNGLTKVNIPSSVSVIGCDAFAGCKNLSAVNIPASVVEMESLENNEGDGYYINDNNSVGVFSNCPNLVNVSVEIAKPLEIWDGTFSNAANATLYVPSGSVPSYKAAEHWKEFKLIQENGVSGTIYFEDAKVEEICVSNWDTNGDGRISMDEAASVTDLGSAFQNSQISTFNELRYFTGLNTIANSAFNNSTVSAITLPENITGLDDYAFLKCTALKTIHLPANVKTIGKSALSRCAAMTGITVDENNETFCSVDGVLFTKDKTTLIQFPIAKSTSYMVPDGTVVIGRDAFFQCNLTSVSLPTSLKELVYDAFGYCKSLTELVIPEGVTTIGDYVVDHCTNLVTLRIPSTVTTIGQRMCNGCNAITNVYSGIEHPYNIDSNNFSSTIYANATLHVPYTTQNDYASLTGWKEFVKMDEMGASEKPIVFADSNVKERCVSNWDKNKDGELSFAEAAAVTTLGTVFQNAQISSFDELRFFTGLISIDNGAFSNSSLKSVTLPESIISLEDYAFLYCKSLSNISLPAKLQSIGKSALSGCTAMQEIQVASENEKFCSVDGVLYSKDKKLLIQFPAAKATKYTIPDGTETIGTDAFFKSIIESVSLPSSLRELEYDAFGASKNLGELIVPEGVTTIGDYILDQCYAIKVLHIPSSVTSVGQKICGSSNSITDVYCDIQNPFEINSNCFTTTTYTNATLHVPYGTGGEYAVTEGWKEFSKIVEAESPYSPYAVLSSDKKTLTFYADQEKDTRPGTVFTIEEADEQPAWFGKTSAVTKVVFDKSFENARPKTMYRWFYGMSILNDIEGMEYLNTSHMTNMKEAFYGCSSIKQIDVSLFDIANVTDLSSIFNGCSKLAWIDLSTFILKDGSKTNSMLLNCSALKTMRLHESLSVIASDACKGIGSSGAPCILFVPKGFDFGVNATGTFLWKSGYFRVSEEPIIYADNVSLNSGQTKNVVIRLKNGEEQYNSYQFDLTMPEGFSLETNARGNLVYTLSERYTDNVNVSGVKLSDDTYRITAYMNPGEYITGSDGAIITLRVIADELPAGTWIASLENVFVGMTNNISIKCKDQAFSLTVNDEFPLGDANHDGYINMSDVTVVIEYILGKSPSRFYVNEADVNEDGWINMSDVTNIISIILGIVPNGAPANSLIAPLDQIHIEKTSYGYDLYLNEYSQYSACEMTLQLPDGCSLKSAKMGEDRIVDHKVLSRGLGNGLYRVAVYSSSNSTLRENEAPMLHLVIDGTPGDDVNITDILFIDNQDACVSLPDVLGTANVIHETVMEAGESPSYSVQGTPMRKDARGIHIYKGRKNVVR